jgi:hypothetical protein
MVHSTFQHLPTPPQSHTVCIYVLYIGKGGGEGGQREGTVEGQQYKSKV